MASWLRYTLGWRQLPSVEPNHYHHHCHCYNIFAIPKHQFWNAYIFLILSFCLFFIFLSRIFSSFLFSHLFFLSAHPSLSSRRHAWVIMFGGLDELPPIIFPAIGSDQFSVTIWVIRFFQRWKWICCAPSLYLSCSCTTNVFWIFSWFFWISWKFSWVIRFFKSDGGNMEMNLLCTLPFAPVQQMLFTFIYHSLYCTFLGKSNNNSNFRFFNFLFRSDFWDKNLKRLLFIHFFRREFWEIRIWKHPSRTSLSRPTSSMVQPITMKLGKSKTSKSFQHKKHILLKFK